MGNNQDKDFNQFFQKKMNNRQFDYEDSFWEEMESQLPETSSAVAPKGEVRKRLLLLLLLMVGFVSIFGWFTYPAISNSLFITKGKIDLKKTGSLNEHSVTNINSEEGRFLNNSDNFPTDIIINEIIDNNKNNSDANILVPIKKTKVPTTSNSISNKNNDNIRFDKKIPFKFIEKGIMTNTKENKNTISDDENVKPQPIAGISKSENENLNENVLLTNDFSNPLVLNSILTKQFLLENEEAEKSNLIKPNCDGCPVLPPSHQFKIGLIAGLNTSLGFQNGNDNRAKTSLDPSIGFRLTYRHSMISRWRTDIEAIYFSRSALNAQVGYDSISYGFGSTIISRSIDVEELHYISLPILATYQYNKKHAFMGGLSFSYLLNAQSQTSGNVTEFTATNENILAEPTTQEWGYTTAFNRFDVGATLGYDYEVQKGWKVGARFNYGLRDITKNNIFDNNIFDNNISLRLVMTCDLFIL